jgi:hypothetical protein
MTKMKKISNRLIMASAAVTALAVASATTAFAGSVDAITYETEGGVQTIVLSPNYKPAVSMTPVQHGLSVPAGDNVIRWESEGGVQWIAITPASKKETASAPASVERGVGFVQYETEGGVQRIVYAGEYVPAIGTSVVHGLSVPAGDNVIRWESEGGVQWVVLSDARKETASVPAKTDAN